MRTDFSFTAEDGLEIYCYYWEPKKVAKGVLHIIHGSLEHARRYEHFAEFLADQGYAVYAADLRGHGKTAQSKLSYFSDRSGGWQLVLNEIRTLDGHIRAKHPDMPLFLLGHSMGSILVRCYHTPLPLAGLLLSGTGGGRPILLHTARLLARVFMLRGRDRPNSQLHHLVYGSLNIPQAQTPYDFLSRDSAVVQRYIADPLCGATVTPEYIYEMTGGILEANAPAAFAATAKNLPVLLFSGEKDPVGGTKGGEVQRIYERYLRAGLSDVQLQVYPEAYHEMLNEINKEEVYHDILKWMNVHI